MKDLGISLAILTVGLLGVVNHAQGSANDRFYIAGISPSATTPLTTTQFHLTVTNDLKSGPLHPFQQIILTVPTGFTLVPLPGGFPAVTAPPHWTVSSVAGQVVTIITTNGFALPAGKSVTILVNAQSPAASGTTCGAAQAYPWLMTVSQTVNTGTGNQFFLRAGTSPATVSVAAAACINLTNLALSINPGAIQTTNASAVVTLTATLTSAATSAGIASEPITFTVGGEPVICQSPAITDANGVATCSYTPQNPSSTALVAGIYDTFANFAGDTTPTVPWGTSLGGPVQLTVNATGTGITVLPATGPFGGTVNLQATLVSGGLGVVGRTVTFKLNNVSVGTGTTTDSNGVSSLANVSLAGINAGLHATYIEADFAGDTVYTAASNTADLTVTAVSTGISLSNLTQTYTGAPLSPTVTTNPTGLSHSVTGFPQTNVGSYPVSATITDPNYSGTTSGTFVIAPATVTATITAANKVYDTTTAATITNCSLSGVVAADVNNLTCSATGVFSSANAGTWTVTATSVTLGGSAAGNYQVSATMPTTTATISPAGSSVTVTGGSFTYDGSAHLAAGSASTTVGALSNPNAVTITYSGSCGTSPPTTVAQGTSCTATGTYAGDGNHTGSNNTAAVVITLASSSVAVTGGSFPYDGAAHAASGLASTTAGSLTAPATVTIGYSGSCSAAPITVADGTSCLATGTYAGDANHAGSFNTASVTITKASQTISLSFAISASASSGLPVTLGATGTACSISGGTVTILGTGGCTVTATQGGDGNYNSTSRTISMTIQ